MVGEACLPSNAYYPRTPDYTLCSGVHVCWSEHSDSSFVYGFMILNYGFGTMTATTYNHKAKQETVIGCIVEYNCLFLLRFCYPVNPIGPCRAQSVNLITFVLGRLSSQSG